MSRNINSYKKARIIKGGGFVGAAVRGRLGAGTARAPT